MFKRKPLKTRQDWINHIKEMRMTSWVLTISFIVVWMWGTLDGYFDSRMIVLSILLMWLDILAFEKMCFSRLMIEIKFKDRRR